MSSLTNFALALLVARAVTAIDFGAFSIAFSIYLLVLNFTRSIATEPLLVRPGEGRDEWSLGVAAAAGMSTIIGCAAGVICVGAGSVLGGRLGEALIALGFTFPGLLIQDGWRYAFFAQKHGEKAFANDLVWVVTLAVATAALRATHHVSVFSFVLAWGASASVAAGAGVLQARVIPRPARTISWWRQQRDLTHRYLGEFSSVTGAGRLSDFGVGGVAGLAALGSLRGAQVLMGPLNVLLMGARLVAVPEGVGVFARSPRRLLRLSALVSVTLAIASVSWGLLILVLPTSVGSAVLGATWESAHRVAFPIALSMAASGTLVGAGIGLRAMLEVRRALKVRVVVAILLVASTVGGAMVAQAVGAAWGAAGAYTLGAGLMWMNLRRAMEEGEPSQVRNDQHITTAWAAVDGPGAQ